MFTTPVEYCHEAVAVAGGEAANVTVTVSLFVIPAGGNTTVGFPSIPESNVTVAPKKTTSSLDGEDIIPLTPFASVTVIPLLVGRITIVRLEQPENASSPISVISLCMTTDVILVFSNAFALISVTVYDVSIVVGIVRTPDKLDP